MILKIQDLKKLDLNTSKIALFYGKMRLTKMKS